MIVKSKSINKDTKKGLYLVSTPIGNLKDITFRAVEILKISDYILCEDTRVSQNLMKKYEINAKLISNHKFNEKKNLSKIIKLLNDGAIISLISDAGTPSISDPGSILIKECLKENINITPVPGPSAVSTAMSVSGFSEKFFFYGFFPEKKKEISDFFTKLSNLDSSIVFFISSKKFNKTIPIIKNYFHGRKLLICREMSKYYEEFIRLKIDEMKPFDKDLRGELTIIISEKNEKKTSQNLSESDKRAIKRMINKFSTREIINFINQNNKISKKVIYDFCLKLKNEN
tara:strand:- start:882 stop:1742 length:861 start_codon:yes stop_codon:yes gene_type:complete